MTTDYQILQESQEEEHECKTDDQGLPRLRCWHICEPLHSRPIAVVEAYTAAHARARFTQLGPHLRESFRHVIDEFFSVSPLTDDADPQVYPMFLNAFFDIVDASNRIKH